MSTLRVNTIQNVAGSGTPAINGLAKAWVNFNGTGTVAIRASSNISSITDNGVGDYTLNFTTALADENYATIMTSRFGSSESNGISAQGPRPGSAYSTTAVRVVVTNQLGSSVGMWDADAVYVAIFR